MLYNYPIGKHEEGNNMSHNYTSKNIYFDNVLGVIDMDNDMDNKKEVSICVAFGGSYFCSDITVMVDIRYDIVAQIDKWVEIYLNEAQTWNFN